MSRVVIVIRVKVADNAGFKSLTAVYIKGCACCLIDPALLHGFILDPE
jgi:hypothetical protein